MDFMLAVAGTLSRACGCGLESVGGIYKKENGESLSTFSVVPRPAFEIIKVGKMWVKRKMQKNTAI